MGWRANMGVMETENKHFDLHTQYTQYTQNPTKKPDYALPERNIADIADIAVEGQKLKKQNSKTIWCSTNCEHGERKTINDLPVLFCQVEDMPVIDLDQCPAGHWIKNAEGRPRRKATSGIPEKITLDYGNPDAAEGQT